tara:strand:+ start:14812 stop:15654 length:843 start_codon:yes stop_codon:yes gene_type:complete
MENKLNLNHIESFHEFGYTLGIFLPRAYDNYLNKTLGSTKGKIGSSSLFYFSPAHTEELRHVWDIPSENQLIQQYYQFSQPNFTQNGWTPPPLKLQYENSVFTYQKPILTINNKNTIEWDKGLFSYFPVDVLDMLFTKLKDYYQIVYIRPPETNESKYQRDTGVRTTNIGDIELIRSKHPDVLYIGDVLKEYPNKTYNEIQMMFLANSNHHISSGGGDAFIAGYFGGELLMYIPHPNIVPQGGRGVWKSNSWLELLSGSKVTSFHSYDEVLNYVNQWVHI